MQSQIQTDIRYRSNGQNVYWPIPFPYANSDSIGVKIIDSTGTENTLTKGVEYQVNGKYVICVVPEGKQIEIWLTTSLEATDMPSNPALPLPGPGHMPAPGYHEYPAPTYPAPLPPLGDPWADRHLGVLSAEVMDLKREVAEGLAIERARECDAQVMRLRAVGKRQADFIQDTAESKLQSALSIMENTSSQHANQLNTMGTTLTRTAQHITDSASAAQRHAIKIIALLARKNGEIKRDLFCIHSQVEKITGLFALTKQQAERVASIIDGLNTSSAQCAEYLSQIEVAKGIVDRDRALVAEDRSAVNQMRTGITVDVDRAAEARTAAEAAARDCAQSLGATQQNAQQAEASAARASNEADRAGNSAQSAQADAASAQNARSAVEELAQTVAADKATVVSIKDDAEAAVHAVAVELITQEVVQEAADVAAAQAAAQATQQAQASATSAHECAIAARNSKEDALTAQAAAEDAARTARDNASVTAANVAVTQENADNASRQAESAESFAQRAEAASVGAKADADRAEAAADTVVNAVDSKLNALYLNSVNAAKEFYRLSDRETRLELALIDAGISIDFLPVPPINTNPGGGSSPYSNTNFVQTFENALAGQPGAGFGG